MVMRCERYGRGGKAFGEGEDEKKDWRQADADKRLHGHDCRAEKPTSAAV